MPASRRRSTSTRMRRCVASASGGSGRRAIVRRVGPKWSEIGARSRRRRTANAVMCLKLGLEAPPGFEPGMEVLQTSALPLGDGAARSVCGGCLAANKGDLNRPSGRRPAAGGRQEKSRPDGRDLSEIWSGKRDSNPRLRPWQGRTLPLSYSRPASARPLHEHGPTAVCEEVMVPQPRKRRQGARSVSPWSVARSVPWV